MDLVCRPASQPAQAQRDHDESKVDPTPRDFARATKSARLTNSPAPSRATTESPSAPQARAPPAPSAKARPKYALAAALPRKDQAASSRRLPSQNTLH